MSRENNKTKASDDSEGFIRLADYISKKNQKNRNATSLRAVAVRRYQFQKSMFSLSLLGSKSSVKK